MAFNVHDKQWMEYVNNKLVRADDHNPCRRRPVRISGEE